ncbi:MAG TPA: SdrD B-like domain-containing protein, partial [Accumulibacter sp.]|nr:SdrD B-like domain-containing protein [Accumulibacter sp.]
DTATDSDFTAAAPAPSNCNLIVNGSFENYSCLGYTSSLPGWNWTGDYFYVNTASCFGATGASGSIALELDASSCYTGGIYQDVQTTAGQTYRLSVDLAMRSGTSSSTNSVEVWWGSTKIATVDPTSTALTTYTFDVVGTGGATRLKFMEQTGDNDGYGGIIDNVKLCAVTSNAGVAETAPIVINSCADDLTIDAGLVLPRASIGDRVWEDLNYNGIQDAGEAGIAGVTVKLLNSVGSIVATTTTNASGNYLFSNLNPGDYKIQVVAPTGYYITKADIGSNDAVDSDIAGTGYSALTTLVTGENDLSWDAGLYRKCAVGDKVWFEENYNYTQDSWESPVVNVKVSLLNAAGAVIATTYTDCNGQYLFSNLDPGTYAVQFDKSPGYTYGVYTGYYNTYYGNWASKDVGYNDAIDSDVNYGGYSTQVTKTDLFSLVSGQTDLTRDAGITPIVIDLNGDGIQTISRENSGGQFDLLGNGKPIASGWLSGEDGFLAFDANGNGRIDSISELFGGQNQGSGFAQLAAFDSNGDGVVNAADAHFGELRIWQDANDNHQTDAGELMTLVQAGIVDLNVSYHALPALDAQLNLHLERSAATLANGTTVDMTDVYFNVDAAQAAAAGATSASMGELMNPGASAMAA